VAHVSPNLALTGFTEMHRKKPVKICGILSELVQKNYKTYKTCLRYLFAQATTAVEECDATEDQPELPRLAT